MDRQNVPRLDLSFAQRHLTNRLSQEKANDVKPMDFESNSIAGNSPRAHSFRSEQSLASGRPSSVASSRYSTRDWNGMFTPYTENRTTRQVYEEEFKDANRNREIIESELFEKNARSSARPNSAAQKNPRRVAFGARLLTESDVDALREFTGFFWSDDSTLALYEFRGFNKTTGRVPPRVLPFISRGRYKHAGGVKAGNSVDLTDVTEGRDIILLVSEHVPALNDALRDRSIFIVRVTNVDLTQKRAILCKDVRISDQDDYLKKLHGPQSAEEAKARGFLFNIRSIVRNNLKNRGIPCLLNMRHELGLSKKVSSRQMNESIFKNKYLSREEVRTLVDRFNIKLNDQEIDELYSLLDLDQNGEVDFGEFVRGMIGGMSETRHAYVHRAWVKMDPSKTGQVTIATVKKFYSARTHPDVVEGQRTEQEIVHAFVSMLHPPSRSHRLTGRQSDDEGIVGFGEFLAYYEGLSLAVDADEDFIQILKETWGNLAN